MRVLLEPPRPFPRSADRGLIEATAVWLNEPLVSPFPRSADRGLIEAPGLPTSQHLIRRFPRSADRGLIEAPVAFRKRNPSDFRDQLIAASLKRRSGLMGLIFELGISAIS